MDLNRLVIRDRIREQTETAAANRLAAQARRSIPDRRADAPQTWRPRSSREMPELARSVEGLRPVLGS